MFYCVLCKNPDEYCYSSLCSKCTEFKKIVDLFGIDDLLKSVKYIYVRGTEPIKNRTEVAHKINQKNI